METGQWPAAPAQKAPSDTASTLLHACGCWRHVAVCWHLVSTPNSVRSLPGLRLLACLTVPCSWSHSPPWHSRHCDCTTRSTAAALLCHCQLYSSTTCLEDKAKAVTGLCWRCRACMHACAANCTACDCHGLCSGEQCTAFVGPCNRLRLVRLSRK
jgi:hypothetical protein